MFVSILACMDVHKYGSGIYIAAWWIYNPCIHPYYDNKYVLYVILRLTNMPYMSSTSYLGTTVVHVIAPYWEAEEDS